MTDALNMPDHLARDLPAPREFRRRNLRRTFKDPSHSLRADVNFLKARARFLRGEEEADGWDETVAYLTGMDNYEGLDFSPIGPDENALVALKLRACIHDRAEAMAARAAYLATCEAMRLTVPEGTAVMNDLDTNIANLKALAPFDNDAIWLAVWHLERLVAARERERRDARRKPPREVEVVEVPPVVIDTTCDVDGCQRERHFIIEGVAYCKRHVPPHLRPHGRI